MNFFTFFNIVGMVVWLSPPFRQFRTKYFLFFLVLGIADFAGFLASHFILSGQNHIIYIITAITTFFSLLEKKFTVKYIAIYVLLVLGISGIYTATGDILVSTLTLIFFNLLILLLLFKELLNDFFENKVFSIFLGMLVFYQFTTITKMATLLTGYANGYLYFGTTTAIQIFFGLFFSIFRYDFKRFILQLK